MRPTSFQKDATNRWVLLTYDPDKPGVLKDASSTPTIAVRKNGGTSADSVTITKRAATTGIYDCSHNPAGEAEGDQFHYEESATVVGSTSASATYNHTWSCVVDEAERGTDNASTFDPATDAVNIDRVGGSTVSLANLKSACDSYTAARGLAGTNLDAASSAIVTHLTEIKGAGWSATDSLKEITEDVTGLDGQAMRGTDGAALAAQWTATRAGYLDNLSAGAAATQASVDTLTNAVRNQISVPGEYQLPSAGSERFKIVVLTYDASGALNDPDSNTITLAVENAAGTSRSGNLYDAAAAGSSTTTMVRDGTGQYHLWYEVDSADAEEQLNWTADYDEGAVQMLGVGSTVLVAIASGGGFNAADRTKLEAAYNKLPTALYLLGSANADGSGYSTHTAVNVRSEMDSNSSRLLSIDGNADDAASAASAAQAAAESADGKLGVGGDGLTDIPRGSAWIGDVVQGVQDAVGENGELLTMLPYNSAWNPEIERECADALTAAAIPASVRAEMDANSTVLAAIAAKTAQMVFTSGYLQVIVQDVVAAALAKFLSLDTGEVAATDGSVGKISQGAAGGAVTVSDLTPAALAKFATTDTGEASAADGSVAKLAQGAGGGGGDALETTSQEILGKVNAIAASESVAVGSGFDPATYAYSLILGDDYLASNGGEQDFTTDLDDTAGYSVRVIAWHDHYGEFDGVGSLVSDGEDGFLLRVEWPSESFDGRTPACDYQWQAKLINGDGKTRTKVGGDLSISGRDAD